MLSGMQVRNSTTKDGVPACPFSHERVERCIHRHGNYQRYESPEGDAKRGIPRFLCLLSGRTISVIPDDMLPYWAVSTEQIQSDFDGKSQSE